jgi:hypothetical protein
MLMTLLTHEKSIWKHSRTLSYKKLGGPELCLRFPIYMCDINLKSRWKRYHYQSLKVFE